MTDNDRVIALLIDAENVSPKYIQVILDELSVYGTPAYKRIYGDWTSGEMASWKKCLLESNLTPIQQFSYTQGKNASDSAMIIDAMDILYTKNCDGFCIVSSDSDFTRLAARLRESRMFVIGMGESKTPTSFKSACDTFKYLDVLLNAREGQAQTEKKAQQAKTRPAAKKAQKPAAKTPQKPAVEPEPEPAAAPHADPHEESALGFVPLEEIVARVKTILDKDSDEDGFMGLSQVGSILGRMYADFDTRNYGFSKLHKLLDYTGEFETKYEQIPGGGKNLMVKNK
ncbi:NYN domain-containing protein [Ruminococcaceae bacterium OttesenSCG-928-O06]|nr:NYN domain-containing protein [Ruminococcaceae bacterium OttesenSCG-928-O06]